MSEGMSKLNEHRAGKLHGIWALTNRELKKWYKAPVIFTLSIIQPILWMGLLGKAMNLGALFEGTSFMSPDLVASLQQSLLTHGMPQNQIQPFLGDLGNLFSTVGKSIMTNTFMTADYFSFMAVGMISFTALFTTAFSGMSVVWDRR
jgi:ABC-2 type transport system permease protein